MKRRNIAFSGFMAAILLGAGAANAATTQIASRQYVDAAVDEIQTDVDALDTVVNDPESGLAAQVQGAVEKADAASSAVEQLGTDVGALKTTVGDEAAGLVKDVDDLQGQVGTLGTELDSKLDSATADGKYEVLTNKATEINDGNQSSSSAYPSVGAIVEWTNQKISELSDTGLPVNPGNINDNSIAGSKLENGAVTTDKIANDAVNGDKIADDSIGAEHIADGAVGSDAIADGSVTGADIANGTISADKLDSALNAKINGKEDKINKATTIDSTNQASTDAYPSVKAVYDWTTAQIANVEFDPSTDLGVGSVSGDKITDGTITGDKIADDAIDSDAIADNAVGTNQIADGAVTADKLDSALNAEIDGKQDKNMGAGHESHIVTTDASGNITSAATIGQDKVTGLTTALAGKADASALEEIEQNVTNVTEQYETINKTVTNLGDTINNEENGLTQQITNITQQIGNAESGLVKDVTDAKNAADAAADAAGAAQDAVDALETTVDGKADKATTLAGYGITDAYTKTETDGLLDAKADESALANYATTTALTSGLAGKEDTSNKTKIINDGNKSSETLFPTIGAITTWTDQQIQQLSTEGIPVNPDNIGSNAITTDKIANGAVTTPKIADKAVTEDKLSDELNAEIDGKANAADVYTKLETDGKIVELAVPQPDADCQAESGLCVLSITTDGDLAWVNVTAPAETTE